MSKPTGKHERIRRMHARGYSVRDIGVLTGLTREQVKEVLGIDSPAPPKPASPEPSEHEKAIAELRREGYSDAAIAAVFGE